MRFPTATWQIHRPGSPSYLFVDADSGRMVPVTYDRGSRCLGFGLWFHDIGDYEIATTHIKRSGSNLWLHEFYRIDGDFMQWSNFAADIFHEKVSDDEVPPEFRNERDRILKLSALLELPEYDPANVRTESKIKMGEPQRSL